MILVLLVALSSCSKKPRQDAFSFQQPMAESMRFRLAVYLLPGPAQDPAAALQKALAAHHAQLKLVPELPKEPREPLLYARLEKSVRLEYPPPSRERLRYGAYGLSDVQAERLQKSERAFIVEFAHPRQNVWTALRTANTLVEEIARRTGGLVWDEETRGIYSPDAWHKARLSTWTAEIPDVSSQTVIHIYQNDEYARAISLGMAKMGLPDVVVQQLPWSSKGQIMHLINTFSQALAEGAAFEKSGKFNLDLHAIKNAEVRQPLLKSMGTGSTGKACLLLKPAKGDEGDPENRLIELASDRYQGNDSHARQESMLSSFLGVNDSIRAVHHNQELLDASAKARARLPELQNAFNAGLQPGEFIQVKAPFSTPDGNREWMWVEVTSWKQHKIKGLLQNEPYEVTSLHSGQVVEVDDGDVFDYIRQHPDKQQEGNATAEVLQKMEDEKIVGTEIMVHAVSNACDQD